MGMQSTILERSTVAVLGQRSVDEHPNWAKLSSHVANAPHNSTTMPSKQTWLVLAIVAGACPALPLFAYLVQLFT